MKRTRQVLVAIAATAAVMSAVAGCGGSDAEGRPSASDISSSLRNGKAASLLASGTSVTAEAADCMGKALHDSDLSDEALRALVDGDKDYQGSSDDAAALTDLNDDMSACIGTK